MQLLSSPDRGERRGRSVPRTALALVSIVISTGPETNKKNAARRACSSPSARHARQSIESDKSDSCDPRATMTEIPFTPRRMFPIARRCTPPVTLAAMLLPILMGGVFAIADDSTAWLTGKPLQEQLAEPVGVAWGGVPLRATLDNLARARRVAVLLDRRVDPGREVNLTTDATPLKSVIGEVAQRLGLDVCQYQSVAYLGPPGSAARLKAVATLRHDDLRRLPAAAARRFSRQKPLRWDDFATPRQVLAELGRSGPVHIEGEDRVPHDLLAAADLPAMTLVDRLTLLLFQFDLTFEVTGDGKGIKVVPLPEDVASLGTPPGQSDQAGHRTSRRRQRSPRRPVPTRLNQPT